jgi:RimJ/RimL family protein N-acetyltransferase
MSSNEHVVLTCTAESFRPVDPGNTRWWSRADWRDYYAATDGALGWGNSPHPKGDWEQLYDEGHRFCDTLDQTGRAVAMAGLWPRTDDAWEVIAVGVAAGRMNRGLGRAVVSFVTDEILRHGRRATITTRKDNPAMQRAARAIGYR